MKCHLERIDAIKGLARFYIVAVVPTLFGSWSVVREWGRIGQGGTIREKEFIVAEDAIHAARACIDRKQRRGYARLS